MVGTPLEGDVGHKVPINAAHVNLDFKSPSTRPTHPSGIRELELHPHVHCVVPAGGLSADHTRWIKPRYDFFLPVKVLSRVFRGKFHEALKRAFHDGKLNFHGDLKLLAQPKTFAAWLRPLF
jgi:hypothetical protein